MRVTKKPYSRVIFFFRCKSCKPAYTTYSGKKKLHHLTVFLLHAFTAKKKILHDLTVFLLHAFTAEKKKLHDLQQKKKITRPDGFLLHAFTAEKKSVRGYVATLPTCGPLLILPPALQRWGSPIRQG